MRRFFICTDVPMIQGNAGFNYLIHMAQEISLHGVQVILMGIGDNVGSYYKQLKNIKFESIDWKNKKCGKISRYIEFARLQIAFGRKCVQRLNNYKITDEDYFIFYPMNISIIKCIKNKFKCLPNNNFSVVVVEWMQPEDYKLGILDPAYWCFYIWFHFVVPKIHKIIPISYRIERFYRKKGNNTFVLRPLIDVNDINIENLSGKKNSEKRKFIYTGGAENKDAIAEMIYAIDSLCEDDKKKIELHLTGVSYKTIQKLLKKSIFIFNNLVNQKIIILHDWMEYDKLMELYCEMDYLLLARMSKISTESNFPSKLPESMLCGVVPVCSNVGDYVEIIQNEAIIFEGYKKENIKNAIVKALSFDNQELKKMKSEIIKKVEFFDIHNDRNNVYSFLTTK